MTEDKVTDMTKTVFQSGTIVTSDFMNAINNPIFDGQDLDGHRPKVTDDELSDTGIKLLINNLVGGFEVTALSGTTVNQAEGNFRDSQGDIINKATENINLPSSGTHFVQLDSTGQLVHSTAILPLGLPLAKVVTSGGAISSLVDLRSATPLQANSTNIRIFGGIGGELSYRVDDGLPPGWDGDTLVVGSSTGLTGEHFFKDFTVASGSSVVVTGGCRLYCSGNVDISGVVVVTPIVSGGKGFAGTAFCPSDLLASSGNGLGGSSGHGSGVPNTYHYSLSAGGSGGASGYGKVRPQGAFTLSNLTENISLETGDGGDGGGFFIVECGGQVSISGSISCPGGHAGSITEPTGIDLTYQRVLISAPGGGSGGLIWIKSSVSITTTPAMLLSVKGGNGGMGYLSTNIDTAFQTAGGGGGGGGWIILQSPNNNLIAFDQNININTDGGLVGNTYGTNPGNTLSGSPGASYGGLGGDSANPGDNGQFLNLAYNPL